MKSDWSDEDSDQSVVSDQIMSLLVVLCPASCMSSDWEHQPFYSKWEHKQHIRGDTRLLIKVSFTCRRQRLGG